MVMQYNIRLKIKPLCHSVETFSISGSKREPMALNSTGHKCSLGARANSRPAEEIIKGSAPVPVSLDAS